MDEELLREILSKVDGLGSKMDKIEERMASLEDRMTSLEDRVASLEDRVASLEDRMTSLEDRVTHIEETMATKEDVAEIPFIKGAVIEIHDELGCVKKTGQETREDVQLLKAAQERLEKVQSDQQKIIELLSIKTTVHEAKLKWAELKWAE
ncbi:hypothetical protein DCC39_15845 [Pueribacillus theae]|uniref:Uncharacterized protein n=1 Tax=Pueribacillus theae TaxID=2171751 RepID=A0A2U1JSC7_9BACI|nr:hypothetical protein [Pueribacillus theae]PWA07915.1 hypothetical protein DCC39_15845 [Pueribacillus theae]